MKIILVFVLILANCLASAQIQWAPKGAKWYIEKIEGTAPLNVGYVLYEVNRDTIMQDKKVSVISRTYYHSNGKDISALENEYTYEQDSIVYFWKNGRFYTLYDFSARPGDKWTVYGSGRYKDYCGYDSLGVVEVDSVTTLTINNQKLKAIYTSPDINSDWHFEGAIIERIGNITHLLPKSKGCLLDTPDDEGSLRCYEDNIIGLYKAGYCGLINCECNELLNYSSVNSISYNSIQVYPNPVREYLDIKCLDNYRFDNFKTAEIYNVQGEKVCTFGNSDKCFVGFLKQGYYVLKLSFSDRLLYLKFMKE